MALYASGVATTATSNNVASWELKTGSTSETRLLQLMTMANASSTNPGLGFGRPQALSSAPTSPVAVQPLNPSDPAGKATTAVAFGVGPTIPLYYLRILWTTTTIGGGAFMTFPMGLVIPASGGVVLWNIGNMVAQSVNILVDE